MKGFFNKVKKAVSSAFSNRMAYGVAAVAGLTLALGGAPAYAQLAADSVTVTAIETATTGVTDIATTAATSGVDLLLAVVGVALIIMVIGLGIRFVYRFIKA